MYDAHCHLAADARPVPVAAPPRSLAGRLLCGTAPEDWEGIRTAAGNWPGTTAAYGLHPWYVARADAGWPLTLAAALAADPGAWVGEIGLDGAKTAVAPLPEQREAFRHQLRLARQTGRGVNCHCVKAWDSFVADLDAAGLPAGSPVIVHAFAGPDQYIQALAERGALFTVGPHAFRHDSPRARRRAALLPADRLLLESDAFLVPGHDAREEVEAALVWLAAARGCPPAELAETIAATSRRVFRP
ncbi:MAG: TatD family hydrolase [Planctomycetes bacterium]|nr:TatD family hydrolase [Planctomycetota bacterium]